MTDRIAGMVSESLEVKRRFFDQHADDVGRAASMVVHAFNANGKLLVFGNGGFSPNAQHIAGELVYRILHELGGLTAIAPPTAGRERACLSPDPGVLNVISPH